MQSIFRRRHSTSLMNGLSIFGRCFEADSMTNVTPSILDKVGRNLHLQKNHPIQIVNRKIQEYFKENRASPFQIIDNISPLVTIQQNFDDLGFPPNHVARSQNDSYFINREYLLRTHTTANEKEILDKGVQRFVLSGDVYRRDEIDDHHYPVFHQTEIVCCLDQSQLSNMPLNEFIPEDLQSCHSPEMVSAAYANLKHEIRGLVQHLFGTCIQMRFIDAFFPYTQPSLEVEIFFNGKWMEVLGCGILQDSFLRTTNAKPDSIAWACGLGLERLAMILFDIQDIRLFWSRDPRFLDQFSDGSIKKFIPFSKHPPLYRDISFWTNESFSENSLFDIARSVSGDLIEKMEKIDEFIHPKSGRVSFCYRITFRSMERPLSDDQVNPLQSSIRTRIEEELRVELR